MGLTVISLGLAAQAQVVRPLCCAASVQGVIMKLGRTTPILLVLASHLAAQTPHSRPWAIEASFGPAQTLEGFTSDCCDPTRTADGTSLGLRVVQREGKFVEFGGDFGNTFVPGRDMKWLMAVGALQGSSGIAPWARAGAGMVVR